MSPMSTSLMSPSETTCEKPMSRDCAQSIIEVTIAPDCVTKASRPLIGGRCAKLAFSPVAGTITPRQLGPTMRMV
jgi:hypothetical protein